MVREFLASLSASGREVLNEEFSQGAHPAAEPVRPGISLDDITPQRLKDADFAARVRAELQAAMRGEI
jgi:hypothetical protein